MYVHLPGKYGMHSQGYGKNAYGTGDIVHWNIFITADFI